MTNEDESKPTTTVRIDVELKHLAKIQAARDHIGLKELLELALKKELKRRKED